MKKQKVLIPVIIILIILIGISSIYFLKSRKTVSIARPVPDFMTSTEVAPNSVTNWKTYTSKKYGFSFKYPENWDVWADGGSFNMLMGPSSVVSTLPESTDENKVVYLMMSGPGQTNLSTLEIEKGGKLKVSESKSKINGLNIITRSIVKTSDNSFSELEIEIIIPKSQYNAVFTIRNQELEKHLNQILSTFKFTQ